MVKQYSKFAQGTCDLKKEIGGSGGSIKIPFNLDFNPKIIFLDGKIEHSAEIDEFCINNQNDIKYEWRGRDSGWIKVALGDSTYCTFKVSNFTYYHTFRILKWYAIG